MSYGYNEFGLAGESGDAEWTGWNNLNANFPQLKTPARASKMPNPSETVQTVDSAINVESSASVADQSPAGWFRARAWAEDYGPGGNSHSNGGAWPRHLEVQCNVGWCDGHVAGARAPSDAWNGIYANDSNALGAMSLVPTDINKWWYR
jgi:prepilin-type processing-associated H-X9-DG protein